MTYDNELILINQTYTQNELGDNISSETEKNVLCAIKSVTRNEFYNAAKVGIKPEIVFVLHKYEYVGERKVIFNNEEYKVIRTYSTGLEEVELTCEKVI